MFLTRLRTGFGMMFAATMTISLIGYLANLAIEPALSEPAADAPLTLEASLSDPTMWMQYELLKSDGRLTAGKSGVATGFYPSPGGQVALSATDVRLLNFNYLAYKRSLEESVTRAARADPDYYIGASDWGTDTPQ